MKRPDPGSLKAWGALLSCCFFFLLVVFVMLDWLDPPPKATSLQPIPDIVIGKPQVVKPYRAARYLKIQLSSMTAVVQNFDHLPNNANSNALLSLQNGAQITVYRRSDSAGLGGPCDIWAIQHDNKELLSLGEAVEARNAAATSKYKALAAFLGSSLIAWAVGSVRQKRLNVA